MEQLGLLRYGLEINVGMAALASIFQAQDSIGHQIMELLAVCSKRVFYGFLQQTMWLRGFAEISRGETVFILTMDS